MQFQELYIL